MKRDGSMGSRNQLKQNCELPFTSMDRANRKAKRRQQSVDYQDMQSALLEENKYERYNIYLSATPFHNVAEHILMGRNPIPVKPDM